MTIRSRWANTNKDRIQRNDKFWNDKKKNFTIAVGASFILIQLLFLGMLSYLYGSVYQDSKHIHNLNFLMVDFDGGIIGESLRRASTSLAGPSFPTIHEKSRSEYPSEKDVVHAVWTGEYWGAILTTSDASQRLSEALVGGPAANTYNANSTITYVYNGARYASQEAGFVVSNMQKLVSITRLAYNNINGTAALASLNQTSPQAVQVLLNPIASTAIDIKPTPQGTKVLYNTVSMVMPIVMQFFFLMAVNGVAGHFNLYSHLPLLDNAIIRYGLCIAYTFIGSLCHVGYQHAFVESDWLSPAQFVQSWMLIWLYMHINFLFVDCLTAFVPVAALGVCFFSWVIFNTTSVVMPFELNPAFYRWGYALPSHEVFQVLITIWSSGGVNTLDIALPVLFAWEILLIPLSAIALRYRCANAAKEFKDHEAAMQEKYGYHPDTEAMQQARQEKKLEYINLGEDTVISAKLTSTTTGNGYFPSTSVPFQDTLQRVLSTRPLDS